MDQWITFEDVAAAERFFAQVCAEAEKWIRKTHRVEGAHYGAMQIVLGRWRQEAQKARNEALQQGGK